MGRRQRRRPRHLTEIRALLTRYGVTDPTAGKADGQFASQEVQALYADLVARGSSSLDAALVTTVYTRLANGSRMHLRAFGG